MLMPMQAIADDSGCKGAGPVIVMAGLVGRSEWWADFSDKWDACLKQEPPIDYFKMREAARRCDQFARFSAPERDAKLIALVRILNEYPFAVLHITVDLAAHARTFREEGAKQKRKDMRFEAEGVANNPYFYAYNTFISAACVHLWKQGEREQFDFIVDEHPSLGPPTKIWYPVVRAAMPQPHRSIMPVEPMTKKAVEFMPLQAADLIAWRQRSANSNSPKSDQFAWLSAHFTTETASPECAYMGKAWFANLRLLMAHLQTSGAGSIEAMIELARLQGAPIPGPKSESP
jgi:hypothetical protein